MSGQDAEGDREKLGSEVAYFLDKKVQSSSFKKSGAESTEEKQLTESLFGAANLAGPAANGEVTKTFHITLAGEEFIAAAGPLPGNMTRSPSGFVVLSSLAAARAP